tara:strand:+ start:85 stop:408 length:324 start_codon:yes stop_codon:yes gene_type:complete
LIFSAAWAYRVNYETRDVVRNLKMLQSEIAKQEDKRIMLEGEWAYLNRPERLSWLSERFFSHLRLMPMSAENFAEIEAIKIKVPLELNQSYEKHVLDRVTSQSGGLK